MKFENIKVGDTVLVEDKVSYGWNLAEAFLVPKKVERVTKTQFIIEGGDKFRKDGRIISRKFVNAYNFGDKVGLLRDRVAKDESELMEVFKAKLGVEKSINKKSESIKIELNSDLSLKLLKEIDGLMDKVIWAIKNNQL